MLDLVYWHALMSSLMCESTLFTPQNRISSHMNQKLRQTSRDNKVECKFMCEISRQHKTTLKTKVWTNASKTFDPFNTDGSITCILNRFTMPAYTHAPRITHQVERLHNIGGRLPLNLRVSHVAVAFICMNVKPKPRQLWCIGAILHLVLNDLSVPLNNNQLACMEANMCDRVI